MSAQIKNILVSSLRNYANQFFQFSGIYLMEDSPMDTQNQDKIKAMRAKALLLCSTAEGMEVVELEKWNNVVQQACVGISNNLCEAVDSELYDSFEIKAE